MKKVFSPNAERWFLQINTSILPALKKMFSSHATLKLTLSRENQVISAHEPNSLSKYYLKQVTFTPYSQQLLSLHCVIFQSFATTIIIIITTTVKSN